MGAARKRIPEENPEGRDEMNLAEFPVALIGKRPPGDVKTLVFEDEVWDRALGEYVKRNLTVTGSDLLGLPTQFDDEVLLACVQLSKQQGFKSPRVEFTRYDLLGILGRQRDGKNYQRVSESLDRWGGTLFISNKAWWDKENQSWVKDTFNIIDRVNLVEKEDMARRHSRGGNQKSWFQWGDFMWKSFQAGNLRELDFQFWKSLENAASKRLYRLLEKRFYLNSVVTFDLHTLAHEKIGLSRNMHTGQIKEKLRPANEELEERGVCKGEFVKKERGKWDVVYRKKRKRKGEKALAKNDRVVESLKARGVSAKKANRLAGRFSEKRIREKLRLFDWEASKGRKKQPGYLVAAVEEDYALPKELTGGEKKRSRPRKGESERVKRAAERQERELTERLDARLSELTPKELQEVEEAALEQAGRLTREHYERFKREGDAKFEPLRRSLLEGYVLSEDDSSACRNP